VLAEPPPQALVDALEARNVPVSLGRSIIATTEPFAHTVLSAIRDLGLEWHVIFNKGSVMVLPSGVNKATGLAAALEELRIPPHAVAAVGDAENDLTFMRTSGLSAAVANALPSVKAIAHIVLESRNGDGVAELIDRLLSSNGARPTSAPL